MAHFLCCFAIAFPSFLKLLLHFAQPFFSLVLASSHEGWICKLTCNPSLGILEFANPFAMSALGFSNLQTRKTPSLFFYINQSFIYKNQPFFTNALSRFLKLQIDLQTQPSGFRMRGMDSHMQPSRIVACPEAVNEEGGTGGEIRTCHKKAQKCKKKAGNEWSPPKKGWPQGSSFILKR